MERAKGCQVERGRMMFTKGKLFICIDCECRSYWNCTMFVAQELGICDDCYYDRKEEEE